MDLICYRIRNPLIYAGWITGFLYQILTNGRIGILFFMTGSLLPILLLFLLFLFRMLGPGDIKLFSVLGGMMGPAAVLHCIFLSLLFGALFSILFLIVCGNLMSRLWHFVNYLSNIFKTGKILPYYQPGARIENFHFSIPIFMSVLLYAGGFYT